MLCTSSSSVQTPDELQQIDTLKKTNKTCLWAALWCNQPLFLSANKLDGFPSACYSWRLSRPWCWSQNRLLKSRAHPAEQVLLYPRGLLPVQLLQTVSAGSNYYVSVHAKEILLARVTFTSRPAYQLGNEVSNEGLIRGNGGKEWEGSEQALNYCRGPGLDVRPGNITQTCWTRCWFTLYDTKY